MTSATVPMSVLCLSQAVDCGGGLVNVYGMSAAIAKSNIHLYFVAKHERAFLF